MTNWNVNSFSNNDLYTRLRKYGYEKKEDLQEILKKFPTKEEALKALQISEEELAKVVDLEAVFGNKQEIQENSQSFEEETEYLSKEDKRAKFEQWKKENKTYTDGLYDFINMIIGKNKNAKTQMGEDIDKNKDTEPTQNEEEKSSSNESIKLTSSSEIQEYLNTLPPNVKSSIEKQINDLGSINSLKVSPNGQITVATDDLELTTDSSGVSVLNTFSGYEDQTQQVEQPQQQDVQMLDVQPQNEQVAQTPETPQTTNPEATNTETSEPQTANVEGENSTNTETPQVTSQESTTPEATTTSNETPIDTNVSMGAPAETIDASGTGDLENQLNQLQQEKTQTQNDLNSQQTNLESTNSEKESAIGQIDSEIETGQTNLDNANTEVDNSQAEVDTATQEVADAQAKVDSSQDALDCAETKLDDANQQVDTATQAENTAAADKTEKTSAKDNAQTESNTANQNLSTATDNTNQAQGVANEKTQEHTVAVGEKQEAFSVLNDKNAKVAAAQSEYNNAKASEGTENAWNRFKNWVSSLLNKLKAAISERDAAQVEADQKAKEEEKALAVKQDALDELDQKKAEQEEAQNVADAAEVVLQKAQGDLQISEQQYADALLTLANAMTEQDEATGEHTTALNTYMEMNNYKADADGNLVDANGNLVSAQQVAQELETYVCGLSEKRTQEETSYDNILNNISKVIQKDEQTITQLDSEIQDVRKQIEEEKKQIALQEQMIAELAKEKSEYNAQENTDGIFDDIGEAFGGGSTKDKKAIESKQEALEQAIMSGNAEDIEKAYKAIYGDKQVVEVDGKIVDASTLTSEQLEQYGNNIVSVSSLDSSQISNFMDNEYEQIEYSKELFNTIENGTFTYNGETLSMEDVTDILMEQADGLVADAEAARDKQGWLSKTCSGVNAQLGIGTTSMNAQSDAEAYQQMVADLKNCKDPNEFATKYKAITGQNFDSNTLVQLLAYKKAGEPSDTKGNTNTSTTTATEDGKYDLTSTVNDVVSSISENPDISKEDVKNSLSVLSDCKAAETIEDYKETQNAAVDAVAGVVSGITSAVVVSACAAAGICAAPFTAGASLGMVAAGIAIGAGTGAATNVLLKGSDSIYDKDGNGDWDFNYTGKDLLKDTFTGALNGAVGTFTNAAGLKVAGSIGKEATKTMICTTGKEALKKTLINFGSKAAGNAIEGFLDGGLSAGAEYIFTCATDENLEFSFNEFLKQTTTGAAFGTVFNVALGGTTDLISGGAGKIKNLNLEKQINEIFADGVSDSKLANTLADSILLDANAGKYINADGTINKYAVDQLRKNADEAVSVLKKAYKKAGIDADNAYKALKGVPIDKVGDYGKVLNAVASKSGADILNSGNLEEGINNLTKNIDGIKINSETGALESFTVKGENGNGSTTFEFNERGLLTNKSTVDGDNIKFEYDAKGNKINATTTANDGSVTKTDYKYNNKGKVASETTTNADGTTTKTDYEYNNKGEKASKTITNSDGSITKTDYEYNKNGKVASETTVNNDGSTKVTKHEYNADGKKTSITEREYDANNTLKSETTTKGNTVTKLDYDADGKVTTETITSGKYTTETNYKYDNDGILSQQTTTSGNKTYDFEFDKDGKVKSATIKSGDTIESLNFEGIENGPALLEKFKIADSANSGNGWASGEVFYKELSEIISSNPAAKTELNKYLNGEYSEIFTNPNIAMQPKDLMNLVQNKEYGANLKAIYDSIDGNKPIKLSFDDAVVEINTNNLKQLLSANDNKTMNIANLATQKQFADNLVKLTNADGTYTEVYDALCKMDYWDSNKFLTLGDFEFDSFNELAQQCDLSKMEGWQFRTITDATNVTSRFELAKQIATDPDFGFTAKNKMPIEYACILANSGCDIPQIKTALDTLTDFDSKFKLDSPQNAATLRLFANVANVNNLDYLDGLIATKQAIMDCEYYLKEMSGDAQISQKYIKLFNQEIGVNDYRLELASTFKEVDARIKSYENILYKSSDEFLKDLNLRNIDDDLATQLDNAFKNGNNDEVPSIITKIMASSDITDKKATREMLITGLRKSGLDETAIQTTMADYDLLVDIKHINKIATDNVTDLGQKEIKRLSQDMAIILALEYPSGSLDATNIESKITDIIQKSDIATDSEAYGLLTDKSFITRIKNNVSTIKDKQHQLPQSILTDGRTITENGMTYSIINGDDFQGYVYSVGALNGGKPMSTHDQLLNYYKILDRAGGRFENEVCSSSYIDANIGQTNVYQNVGVIFDANDNSLICALPYDASTHMGARREQLANYFFESKTMDISAQGEVYRYRDITHNLFDENGNLLPQANESINNGAILSGDKQVLYNNSAANEALLFNPSIKALYFKGAEKDIPDVLKQVASERGLPIVLIP